MAAPTDNKFLACKYLRMSSSHAQLNPNRLSTRGQSHIRACRLHASSPQKKPQTVCTKPHTVNRNQIELRTARNPHPSQFPRQTTCNAHEGSNIFLAFSLQSQLNELWSTMSITRPPVFATTTIITPGPSDTSHVYPQPFQLRVSSRSRRINKFVQHGFVLLHHIFHSFVSAFSYVLIFRRQLYMNPHCAKKERSPCSSLNLWYFSARPDGSDDLIHES